MSDLRDDASKVVKDAGAAVEASAAKATKAALDVVNERGSKLEQFVTEHPLLFFAVIAIVIVGALIGLLFVGRF